MYRIRSTDGLEAEYGSLEEFAAAVRRGEVTPEAEIFHVRANRWLDIKSHPHYRLACSAPSSASSAPAAVAAPPATPVPVVPRAAAPQPRPQHTTLRPQLQSEAPHASAPAAPVAPPKKSNDLVFVDVPGVKAPGAPQKATIIQAQRPPEPKPASPPPLKMEAADQFLVMDTGLESPVRTSKGVRIIKDDLDLLFDQPAPEGTAASPNVVTPVKPLSLTPAQPPVDVIPLVPAPAPEPPKPMVERPAAKAAPEAPARPATVVGRIPVAEPPKPPPAPAPPPAPKPVEPARPVVEKKPEPAPVPVAPAKPVEARPAPVVEAKASPAAPVAPPPEPVKPVVVAPKVEPAARVEAAPSVEPAPKPEPIPAPAAKAAEALPHVERTAPAVDLTTAPHEPVPAPVPAAAPARGSRMPLIAAGVVAVLATGALLVWKPWAASAAPATDVASLGATLPPGGEAEPAAPAPTRVVPDANAPSFGSTAPSVPAPKPAPSQATPPAPVQPAPAAATSAPKDSAKDEEIIAVAKPVLAPMTLNTPTLDLGAAPGSSTSAAPSAVAPSALARNIAAAERTAQQDLAARLGSAGFRAVLAPARLGTADGVAQAKASWSQGAEALRQYRARIGRIEKAYEDSALASQRAERWPASELRAWAAHPSVAEPGETSQVADLMVSQVSEALDLLAGAAGQYEIRSGAISFRSPATAVRYTAIRTWVEQKTANWNATPEGARPHTITALLRALGDGLPPTR